MTDEHKMKIQFSDPKATIDVEIEVGVPWYAQHMLDHSTIYFRRTLRADGAIEEVAINVQDNVAERKQLMEVEVDVRRGQFGSLDYTLGRGIYRASKEEFEEARRDLYEWLALHLPEPSDD